MNLFIIDGSIHLSINSLGVVQYFFKFHYFFQRQSYFLYKKGVDVLLVSTMRTKLHEYRIAQIGNYYPNAKSLRIVKTKRGQKLPPLFESPFFEFVKGAL